MKNRKIENKLIENKKKWESFKIENEIEIRDVN